MCRPKTKRVLYSTAAAVTFATMLSGCSDLYYDRRETIALSGGDAIAANKVEQMVDPWPAHSGNTNIAANGQRMQSAIERYRTDTVIPPVNPGTLNIANQPLVSNTQTTTPPGGPSQTTTTSTQVSTQ
jgi:hypothetical protein